MKPFVAKTTRLTLAALVALALPAYAQETMSDLIIKEVSAVGQDLIPGHNDLSIDSVLRIVLPDRTPSLVLKDVFILHSTLFRSGARSASMKEVALSPWMTRDGVHRDDFSTWTPSMANAPFRLLAVINRPDIRIGRSEERASTLGQIRFIYCLVRAASNGSVSDRPCASFLLAVEIDILADGTSPDAIAAYYEAWAGLQRLSPADPLFNAGIDSIISALRDIRYLSAVIAINEVESDLALGKSPAVDATWVMRSFQLDPSTQLTVPQTVNSYTDREWIAEACRILAQSPASSGRKTNFGVKGALAAAPRSATTASMTLSDSINDIIATVNATCPDLDPQRTTLLVDALAKTTCNGCHFAGTGTLFTHVSPRDVGNVTRLSPFVVGNDSNCSPQFECQGLLDDRRAELFVLRRHLSELVTLQD